MDDPFELYRRLPSHQQRLAAEKKVNCYFVPGTDASGNPTYAYAVASALLHDRFVEAVRGGAIPDFAVVVEVGQGAPTRAVRDRIREYYGFDDGGA